MEDRHAERVVISNCLRQPRLRNYVRLNADDFFHPFHCYLWHMIELYGGEGRLDLEDLAAKLDAVNDDTRRLFSTSRPGDELRHLAKVEYGYPSLETAAEIVRQWADQRRAMEAAQRGIAGVQAEIYGNEPAYTGRDPCRELGMTQPVVSPVSTILPEPLEWLWPARIPRGKLTTILGRPGVGKSLVACDLAARVTKGAPWPEGTLRLGLAGSRDPAGVLILTTDEDAADTLRPRLEAAGADLSRVAMLSRVVPYGKPGIPFDLAKDLASLESALIKRSGVRLVIIDPLESLVATEKPLGPVRLRALLGQLAAAAGRCDVAMVLFSAPPGRDLGASPLVAASRVAYQVVLRRPTKHDSESAPVDQRLLLPVKNTLGPAGDAVRFSLDGGRVTWADGTLSASVLEAIAAGEPDDPATVFLQRTLKGGPVPAAELMEAAREQGISARGLRRALRQLGGESYRQDYAGRYYWRLNAA